MAHQRIVAVAVPCCTTAVPSCEGYISRRQFITWSAWLHHQWVSAVCDGIDHTPPISLHGDQHGSLVHASCSGVNDDNLSVEFLSTCMCV